MTTTIVIPISRAEHLPKLFHALEVMDCDPATTNLLTYIDGDARLYTLARNHTESSRFAQRLCIQRPQASAPKLFDVSRRRERISAIQNEVKQYIQTCDYIFGIEDDTIPPAHTLKQLLYDYGMYPYAGLISGVELGRWGISHVGLWSADDVYEPTVITSLMPAEGVVEVDASGLFCYLTRVDTFMKHQFEPWGTALGPDFSLGVALRQSGLRNYADFSVRCDHLRQDGTNVSLSNTEVQQVKLTKESGGWRQEIVGATDQRAPATLDPR